MAQQCILWDFDGTLARRHDQWSGALLETVARLEPDIACELSQLRPHLQSGFPWHNPERGHEHLATSEDWWDEIFPIFEGAYAAIGIPPIRARQLAREARLVYLEPSRWELFADVLPTLNALRDAGWSHAILSNHVPELSSLTTSLGLADYFVGVHSSASIGFEKPHAVAFDRTLAAIGRPEKVWMVGDNYNADVLGAEHVGIPAVLVRSRHAPAKYQCDSLHEVLQIVGA
jgi:putative hydrolase of the HAD superfamily